MTTAREIITDAYREVNIIPIGSEPTADEFAEALRRLNVLIASVFGTDLGVFMQEWPLTRLYTAPQYRLTPLGEFDAKLPDEVRPYPPINARIITRLEQPKTAFLFPDPQDGARLAVADIGSTAELTLSGNGRRISGVADLTYLPDPAVVREWFYRADLGEWVEIVELGLDDQMFFPTEFDDLWITSLAIRLAPRHGQRANQETAAVNQRAGRKLKQRYAVSEARAGVYDATFYTKQAFNRGLGGTDLLR